MPVITYKKGAAGTHRLWRLMAHMLFPQEEDKERLNSFSASLFQVQSAVFARIQIPTDQVLPLKTGSTITEPRLIASLSEAWFPELMADGTRQAPSSYISAALMTYFLLGLQAARDRGKAVAVSRGKAAALAAYHMARRKNGETLVLKSGKQIMSEWNKLTRASHFWTAYLLMTPLPGRKDPVLHELESFLHLSNEIADHLAAVRDLETPIPPIDFWKLNKRLPASPSPIELQDSTLALLSAYEIDRTRGPFINRKKLASEATAIHS